MKTIPIFLFLFSLSLYAQKIKNFESQNIDISIKKNIDPNKIWITFNQFFDENITYFNIFQDGKFIREKNFEFPNKSGFYTLSINYNMELIYSEIIYYNNNPENEKLTFNFFRVKNKIHCKINSKDSDLNKVVILYKLDWGKIEERLKVIRRKNVN